MQYWGGPCVHAAISKCQNYKTCCGCLNVDDYRSGCYNDRECEKVVCDNDPFCCYRKWDDLCVIQANAECKDETPPICCGCTVENVWGGCKHDLQCEQVVCSVDSVCCDRRWDHLCTSQAAAKCKENANSNSNATPVIAHIR
eukprot:UN00366